MSNGSPRAATSSYAGEIEALFYVVDMAREAKVLLSEVMFGNVGAGTPTYVRNDNSDAVHPVATSNTATSEND